MWVDGPATAAWRNNTEVYKHPRLVWRDSKGRFKACRVRSFVDDMNTGMGSEIGNLMRRKDLEEGCPWCLEELMENASEPDVLARWRY